MKEKGVPKLVQEKIEIQTYLKQGYWVEQTSQILKVNRQTVWKCSETKTVVDKNGYVAHQNVPQNLNKLLENESKKNLEHHFGNQPEYWTKER